MFKIVEFNVIFCVLSDVLLICLCGNAVKDIKSLLCVVVLIILKIVELNVMYIALSNALLVCFDGNATIIYIWEIMTKVVQFNVIISALSNVLLVCVWQFCKSCPIQKIFILTSVSLGKGWGWTRITVGMEASIFDSMYQK